MWKDPHEFNPDRHLNEEGKIVKNEAFVPFGLGNSADSDKLITQRNI